jgi:hypothetical protein
VKISPKSKVKVKITFEAKRVHNVFDLSDNESFRFIERLSFTEVGQHCGKNKSSLHSIQNK